MKRLLVTDITDGEYKTAFTRCPHILKTVKNVMKRPPVQKKTAHFLPADLKTVDFENETLTDTFSKQHRVSNRK